MTPVFYFCFCLCISLALGYHSLVDPDIPWHLAGGLWMLDAQQVPSVDPFGALEKPWVAYSYVPELIIAFAFKRWGFGGLQLLQFLLVAVVCFGQFFFLKTLAHQALIQRKRIDGGSALDDVSSVTALFAWVLSLIFIAPMFHLRPQLLSVLFFTSALFFLLQSRLKLAPMFALTILWANTHVFWIFAPLLFFLHSLTGSSFELKYICRLFFYSALIFFAGTLSPYGIENIRVLLTYAFAHKQAYGIVDEFQPMGLDLGILFWLFIASLIFLFLVAGRLQSDRQGRFYLISLGVFGVATILQRKYLPFYGVLWSSLFLLALISSQRFARLLEKPPLSRMERMRCVLALLLLFLCSILCLDWEAPLRQREADLLALAQRIPLHVPDSLSDAESLIFQRFDEGGWIALALYLSGKNDQLKTSIDGRTLVMGEQRIQEYAEMILEPAALCSRLSVWKPNFALLPKESQLFEELLKPNVSCVQRWELIEGNRFWALLEAHPRSLKEDSPDPRRPVL